MDAFHYCSNQIAKLLTIVPFIGLKANIVITSEIMVYLLSNHCLWNHIIKQAEIVDGYEELTVDKLRGILRQKVFQHQERNLT